VSARRETPRLCAALLLLGVCACAKSDLGGARVVPAQRQDLVMDVEVSGTLKAVDSDQVGPPSTVPDTWEFKIVRMSPEGTRVNPGEEVISFEPSELERRLHDYENEVAAITEELGKSRSEGTLSQVNAELDLEETEARRRKADLKVDKPADLTAERERRSSGIDRDLARREVEFRHRRERARRAQIRSELSVLQSRLDRAAARVKQIRSAIEAMAVKAQRGGTVVYKQDWRGEKKKPGDGTYRGETVLEIASLDRMSAQGQVDEVDASKVSVGQRVGLRLEAHPDREYTGVVDRVAALVRTESPTSRVKVVDLELRLLESDPRLMRPGMRFRGRIEIARVPGVLQVPLGALVSDAQGARVMKLEGRSVHSIPVTVGRRSREMIEIKAGIEAGDRILLRSPGNTGQENHGPVGAT
jgi:HlyD family secretion protein